MAWSEQMVSEFQLKNNKMLAEINASLRPDAGIKTGKIGIFICGQIGDTAQAMGILKYWDILFPNKDAIWFINAPNSDLLRYSNVSEVRPWPWAGFGLRIGEQDHFPYLCNPDNTLNLELAKTRKDTADLEFGFFPATHQVASEKREGLEYSLVSKKVFGVPDDWEWHPRLSWGDDERKMIKNFVKEMPENMPIIMLEVFAGSGQSYLYNIETTKKIIKICREILGRCSFVFASNKHLGGISNCGISNDELFGHEDGFYSAAHFTPRQVALINDYAKLFIGISSGISVVTSAWYLRPTPKIQFCGSKICSTSAISNGNFHLITMDFKKPEVANMEFENKLREVCKTLI